MATRKSILKNKYIEMKLREFGIDSIDDQKKIEIEINGILAKYKSTQQREKNKEYDKATPFIDIYPEYNLCLLPSWIRYDIDKARVIGNMKQTIIMPNGKKYQINNPLNDLSGGEWIYFTNSILNTSFKTSGEDSYAHKIRKIHPTPKPPQLMREIIKFFTKENELVFDYFMGVGGTLLGAGLCGRRAIGIDLNPVFIDAYSRAATNLELPVFKTMVGDCLQLLKDKNKLQVLLSGEKISLVLIDPPYGNMMSKEKTGADIKVYGNVATPFTDYKEDFGNLKIEEFYLALKESLELVLPYVKKRGYIVIFIKDLQPHKKNVNMLHAEIVKTLNQIPEIEYKGLKIWADQTSKLFPYGYPFSFVANQIHQYILIFRKET